MLFNTNGRIFSYVCVCASNRFDRLSRLINIYDYIVVSTAMERELFVYISLICITCHKSYSISLRYIYSRESDFTRQRLAQVLFEMCEVQEDPVIRWTC